MFFLSMPLAVLQKIPVIAWLCMLCIATIAHAHIAALMLKPLEDPLWPLVEVFLLQCDSTFHFIPTDSLLNTGWNCSVLSHDVKATEIKPNVKMTFSVHLKRALCLIFTKKSIHSKDPLKRLCLILSMSLSAGLQLNSNWWHANAHRLSATTSQLSTCGEDCTVSHVDSRTFLPLPFFPIRDFICTNVCTSFTVHLHRQHLWREGIFTKKGVKHKSLLGSSRCLQCLFSKPDMLSQRIGYWQGLPLSFCLPFIFFPSPSLNSGQGPLGFALLCHRKIANLGYTLNSESKSFIKKLICYSLLHIHSISFSQTLQFFCCTGSHCHTPASFLRLFSSSLYTVFILSFPAVTPPSPPGDSHGLARI